METIPGIHPTPELELSDTDVFSGELSASRFVGASRIAALFKTYPEFSVGPCSFLRRRGIWGPDLEAALSSFLVRNWYRERFLGPEMLGQGIYLYVRIQSDDCAICRWVRSQEDDFRRRSAARLSSPRVRSHESPAGHWTRCHNPAEHYAQSIRYGSHAGCTALSQNGDGAVDPPRSLPPEKTT